MMAGRVFSETPSRLRFWRRVEGEDSMLEPVNKRTDGSGSGSGRRKDIRGMGVAVAVHGIGIVVIVGRLQRLLLLLLILADFEEDNREGTLSLQSMNGKEVVRDRL